MDFGHPAHVHYFRNFIKIMRAKGHSFFVTAREREHIFELLEANQIEYVNRGKGANSLIGKILYMLKTDWYLYRLAKKFQADLFLHFGAVYASHVAKAMHKPDIFFDDTENARMNHNFYVPFADIICTPSCFKRQFGKKQIFFPGYMELCYLHPRRFTPDPAIFSLLEIGEREKFVILRFVAWQASHDIGHRGMSIDMKRKVVRELTKRARVFISSEKKLPGDLEQYQLRIPSEKIHDALYYSQLLYGESATMASEAAVLGTPSIYLDDEGRGYTDEEEQEYGLVFNYSESALDQEASLVKAIYLLEKPDLKNEWQKKREKMLNDKIDVTGFMLWLVENYPASVAAAKNNPDIYDQFRSNSA
jgi:predicted glycosyltransferase